MSGEQNQACLNKKYFDLSLFPRAIKMLACTKNIIVK